MVNNSNINNNPAGRPNQSSNIKANNTSANQQANPQVAGQQSSAISSLFKNIPPQKVVQQLVNALKSSQDNPKAQALLTQFNVNVNQQQAMAFSAFACIKNLFGEKIKLTNKEEKEILDAILEEYSEEVEATDPDEEKQKQEKKKQRKEKGNKKVNVVLTIIENTFEILRKNGNEGFIG